MGLLEQGEERAVEKCGGDVSLGDWILLMLNKYCFVLADFTFHPGSRAISNSSRWEKVTGIQYSLKKDSVCQRGRQEV